MLSASFVPSGTFSYSFSILTSKIESIFSNCSSLGNCIPIWVIISLMRKLQFFLISVIFLRTNLFSSVIVKVSYLEIFTFFNSYQFQTNSSDF